MNPWVKTMDSCFPDVKILLICCGMHAGADQCILSAITTLKNQLVDIIEPDFGLLDQLLSLEVLSRREYNEVRSGDKAAHKRSDAVLDLLTSEDQCAKFVKALQRTGQQHIVNFVMQKGGQKRNEKIICFKKPV